MTVGCWFELVCLSAPVTRKKIREVLPALLVFGESAQDIFESCPFIHSARLAGGKQGVYDGGSLGGLVIAAEQIVLPMARGRMRFSTLYHVVVYFVAPVGDDPELLMGKNGYDFTRVAYTAPLEATFFTCFNTDIWLYIDRDEINVTRVVNLDAPEDDVPGIVVMDGREQTTCISFEVKDALKAFDVNDHFDLFKVFAISLNGASPLARREA